MTARQVIARALEGAAGVIEVLGGEPEDRAIAIAVGKALRAIAGEVAAADAGGDLEARLAELARAVPPRLSAAEGDAQEAEVIRSAGGAP